MIFIGKISKGHNSGKTEDGVTSYFFCTSSDDDLYLYKVSSKYSRRYLSYRVDTISIRKISKGGYSVKM